MQAGHAHPTAAAATAVATAAAAAAALQWAFMCLLHAAQIDWQLDTLPVTCNLTIVVPGCLLCVVCRPGLRVGVSCVLLPIVAVCHGWRSLQRNTLTDAPILSASQEQELDGREHVACRCPSLLLSGGSSRKSVS